MNCIRYWIVASVIAGLILMGPAVAFFMILTAEVLIDALMEAGVIGVSAIVIGGIGWVLFRRIWRSEMAQLSGSKEVCEASPIAAPPG